MNQLKSCSGCHAALADQDKFCPSCGQPILISNSLWHYTSPQGRIGPVSSENISTLLRSGVLNGSTLVWTEGLQDWTVISQTVFATITSDTNQDGTHRVKYATFWLRVGAILIDTLICIIGGWGLGAVVGGITGALLGIVGVQESDLSRIITAVAYIASTIAGFLYFCIMESSPCQATLGKMALRMRVVDKHGCRISFARATGRYLAKSLVGLPFGLGYLAVLWEPRKQGWHDRMAATFIIKTN